MPETRRPVRPVLVEYTCDECESGTLNATDIVLSTQPPQYQHQCNGCKELFNMPSKFPKIEYEAWVEDGEKDNET